MATAFDSIPDRLRDFALAQKFFLVASAPHDGRVNVSPKGMDTFRILDDHTVAYLDLTGSGNETAAHVAENGRITFMFMALDGPPMILRFYGQARVVTPDHADWDGLLALFQPLPGTRQIFVATIDRVSSSCGFAVPLYAHQGERTRLLEWAVALGDDGLTAYRDKNNRHSIDGLPTPFADP